ncbi:hypothetical protein [Kribbella sp. DT2]|uniref:hypothetical protein n=1 Tax=Kribbella sp. DT2 TaxID=3393427 RepID=UPI003CF5EA03
MNLGDVMDEIADSVRTITGLRVYAYPPNKIAAPAAIVTYPDTYTFDETYGRGMDRISDLPVIVLVGKVSDRASRDNVAKYVNGSGSTSIKAAVEAGAHTAFDTVRVTGVSFDVIGIGAVEYLGATFTLDIAGQGV